jgi:hypothetical protein
VCVGHKGGHKIEAGQASPSLRYYLLAGRIMRGISTLGCVWLVPYTLLFREILITMLLIYITDFISLKGKKINLI